ISTIVASILRFGFGDPVVLDERTTRLLAGHGRLDALRQIRATSPRGVPGGIATLERTFESGDPILEWRVPVVRGFASKSDAEAEAFLIAVNRNVERGGWDDGGLVESLRRIGASSEGLSGVGYT